MKIRYINKTLAVIVALIMIFMAVGFPISFNTYAAGSINLNDPDTKQTYRAFTEYRTGTSEKTQGIQRQTVVYAYVFAGETVFFGSSTSNAYTDVSGSTSSLGYDIKVTTPDGAELDFNTIADGKGHINTRTKETNGPNMNGSNTAGYTPHEFTVGSTIDNITLKEGIYRFDFYSEQMNGGREPNRDDNNATITGPESLITENFNTRTKTNFLSAWDITVAKQTVAEDNSVDYTVKSGRIFSYYLSLMMGGNNTDYGIYAKPYVLTDDGYIYQVDFNGIDPWGFIFFANNRGLVTTGEDSHSIYKSIKYGSSNLNTLGVTFHNPALPNTEIDKTFKIFYEEPSEELLGILYPKAYLPEPAKNLQFFGSKGQGETGVGRGGTFTFEVTNATSATLIIDMTNVSYEVIDENGVKTGETKTANLGIVKINDSVKTGENSFYWNGKDGNGNVLPVGIYNLDSLKFEVVTKSGEYHFPLIDVENNPNGIKVTRTNTVYDANGEPVDRDEYKNCVYYDNSLVYNDGKSVANNGLVSTFVGGHEIKSLVSTGIKDGDQKSAYIDGDGLNTLTDPAMKFTDGAGDNTALDLWAYSEGTVQTSKLPDTELVISPDPLGSISGYVFYDTNTNGSTVKNIEDGIDVRLSGIEVIITYPDGTTQSTTTNSMGKYEFFNLKINSTYSIDVVKKDNIWNCTTNNDHQAITLGDTELTKDKRANDVGFYYQASKTLQIQKQWGSDNTLDANQKNPINIVMRSYYNSGTGDNIIKTHVDYYEYTLSKDNGWTIDLYLMPSKYRDTGTNGDVELIYEVIGEIITIDNETYYYTKENLNYSYYEYDSEIEYSLYDTQGNKVENPFYKLNIQGWNELNQDITQTVVYNDPIGYLEITKTDGATNSLLSGAEFSLYEGSKINHSQESVPIKTVTTNINGKAAFFELDMDKTYYVIETKPPEGYKTNSNIYGDYTFTEENIMQKIIIENEKIPDMSICKISKILDYNLDENSTFYFNVFVSNDENFNNSIKTIPIEISASSLSNSNFAQIAIETGKYVKIQEIEPGNVPNGFEDSDAGNAGYYELDKSNSYALKNNVKIKDSDYNLNDGIVFQVTDTNAKYDIKINNDLQIVDTMEFRKLWINGTTGEYITPVIDSIDVELQRTTNTNGAWTKVESDNLPNLKMSRDNNWSIVLDYATYELEKYDNLGNLYYYRLEEKTNLGEGWDTKYHNGYNYTPRYSSVTYSLEQGPDNQYGYFIVNTSTTQTYAFIKVDATDNTKILAGVEFNLYICVAEDTNSDTHSHSEQCLKEVKDSSSNLAVYTSDENGVVTINNILPERSYVLKEIKTADGYQLPTGSWELRVAVDRTDEENPIYEQVIPKALGNVPAFSKIDEKYYVGNYPELKLPVTGGFSSAEYKIIGILFISISLLLCYQFNKKTYKNRKGN